MSTRLVVLTGAGISAESGIRTFRDSDGLWEEHRIEDVATPEGFARDPKLVIQFYNERRQQLASVEPNAAHRALARLESILGDRFLLVTQNVDDLHERAGSKRLIHMHGELLKLRCLRHPDHIIPFQEAQQASDLCPHCGAAMRPHIVWFGEIPFAMDEITEALSSCTHFAYIGTSSQVYPAAGFKRVAALAGAHVSCFNLDQAPDPWTQEFHVGKAGDTVPRWVASLAAAKGGREFPQGMERGGAIAEDIRPVTPPQ